MLPFSEKVEVLNFISKKNKSYAEVTKMCSKNKSSHEIMKKNKCVLILLSQKLQPQYSAW